MIRSHRAASPKLGRGLGRGVAARGGRLGKPSTEACGPCGERVWSGDMGGRELTGTRGHPIASRTQRAPPRGPQTEDTEVLCGRGCLGELPGIRVETGLRFLRSGQARSCVSRASGGHSRLGAGVSGCPGSRPQPGVVKLSGP